MLSDDKIKITEQSRAALANVDQLLEKLKEFKTSGGIDIFNTEDVARFNKIQNDLQKLTTDILGTKRKINEEDAKQVETLVKVTQLYNTIAESCKKLEDLNKSVINENDIADITKNSQLWLEVIDDIENGFDEINDKSEEYHKIREKVYQLQKEEVPYLKKQVKNIDECKNSATQMNAELENTHSTWDKITSKIGKAVNFTNRLLTTSKQIFNAISNDWSKFNDAAVKTGRSIGMTRTQIRQLQLDTHESTKKMAMAYGLEYDALLKFQNNYSKFTQRNIQFNERNKEDMAALNVLVGETTANEIADQFDKMGGSLDASTAYMAKQQEMARKMGLHAEQSTNIMSKNMGMLNKYSFKNGVNGFQRMVTLSQQLRFNMESVSASIEKASNWEGAIDMASRMQMLGGSYAAQFSNPGQLMYEALNDAEAFTERIVNTVASKGNFSKQTGKVEINPVDKAFMREMANAVGVSYDELLNMANRSGYNAAAMREMGNGLTKEQKETIANKSQWNAEKQRFEVTYVSSEGKTMTKAVANINPQDLKDIQEGILPEKLEDNVSNIYKLLCAQFRTRAQESTSLEERKRGAKSAISAGAASMTDFINNPLDNGLLNAGQGLNNGKGGWIPNAIGLGGVVLTTLGTIKLGSMAKNQKALLSQMKNATAGGSTGGFGSTTGGFAGTGSSVGSSAVGGGNLVSYGGKQYVQYTTRAGKQALTPVGSGKTIYGNRAGSIIQTNNTAMQGTAAMTATPRGRFLNTPKAKIGAGLGLGIAGTGVEILNQHLVESGKIKQGGIGDKAMTIGSTALQGAGMGAMFGPWGMAIGALGGLAIGAIRAGKKGQESVKAKELSNENAGGTINGDINLNVTGSIKLVAPSGASTELIRELDRPDVQNKIKRIVAYNMAKSKAGGGTVNMGSQDIQQAGY